MFSSCVGREGELKKEGSILENTLAAVFEQNSKD